MFRGSKVWADIVRRLREEQSRLERESRVAVVNREFDKAFKRCVEASMIERFIDTPKHIEDEILSKENGGTDG